MTANPVPESSCGLGPRAWLSPLLWGLAAGLAEVAAAALFVLTKLPLPLRAAAAIVPLVFCLGYVVCVVRMFRRADELQRRIQLESLGFAFPATALVAMAVNLFEQAGIMPVVQWGWSGLVTAMCLLWLVGWVVASRHYK